MQSDATIARVETDPEEMDNSARNIDLPIVGDCKSVLQQLCEAVDARTVERFQPWRQKLTDGEAKKRVRAGGNYPADGDGRGAVAEFGNAARGNRGSRAEVLIFVLMEERCKY